MIAVHPKKRREHQIARAASRHSGARHIWILGAVAVVVFLTLWLKGGQVLRTYRVNQVRNSISDGRFREATELLVPLLDARPDDAELHYLAAVAYRRDTKMELSAKHWHRAKELGWSTEEIERQMYLALAQVGDFEVSEAYLQDLLKRQVSDEVSEEVYEALTKGYLTNFNLDRATVTLDHWRQWKPNAAQPRLWLAQIFEWSSSWEKAIREYQAVLESHPDHQEAREKLAYNYLILNKNIEALEEYRRVVQQHPTSADGWLGLATASRTMGNIEEAEQALSRALELDMDVRQRGLALTELGQIASERKEFKRALELLEQAAQLVPGEVKTRYALGMAYTRTGRRDEGKLHLDASLELQKHVDQLARVFSELYDKPENSDLRYEAGWRLIELGRHSEARFWLNSAIRYQPGHRQALAALEKLNAKTRGDKERSDQPNSPHDESPFPALDALHPRGDHLSGMGANQP